MVEQFVWFGAESERLVEITASDGVPAFIVVHSGTISTEVARKMKLIGGRKYLSMFWNTLLVLGTILMVLAQGDTWPGYAQAPAAKERTSVGQDVDRQTQLEIRQFLQQFLDSFEISDRDRSEALKRAADDMAEDFTAIFYIPKRASEVTSYNKKTMLEALGDSFSKFQGTQPLMKVDNVTVLVRSKNDAVASFTMNFYEKQVFLGDALTIADIRKENGAWHIYRWYESKR